MSENKNNKWLILSDIHSNLEALNAVLDKAKEIGYDRIACLGDLVGYGPNPNEVVDWAIEAEKNGAIFVKGNHDIGIADSSTYLSDYNYFARAAMLIQREMLTETSREFLLKLPETVRHQDMQFIHGSPVVWDEYIHTKMDAYCAFYAVNGHICFVGHTHTTGAWKDDFNNISIVNVGSVGQPRDMNPMSCFAIFDEDTYIHDFHRVAYDIPAVQEKMKNIGMPDLLVQRLEMGV